MPSNRQLGWMAALAACAPPFAAAAAPPSPAPPAPAPAPPAIVQIGSAYFAKQMCSCLFVAGRAEASCRAEFKPRMDVFKIAIDRSPRPRAASVTASLGPVSALATFDPRYGCVLVK
ncbi:MAG: hypothetical protein ABI056_03265 [Caulobacteraceae bacterium]